MGFVETMRSGDTGVGFTLESLLGIAANSNRAPDYKGIELKSGRLRAHKTGKITIFSKTPNWSISNLKSSTEILHKRGRYNEKVKGKALRHTISALRENSYGLKLIVEENKDLLLQVFIDEKDSSIENDVVWPFEILRKSLVEKHRETFWVTAESTGTKENEKFHYKKAKYTSGPRPNMMPLLLDTGVLTVDYTIKEKPNGSTKDQGYLFKIASKNLGLLFKPPIIFDLCS